MFGARRCLYNLLGMNQGLARMESNIRDLILKQWPEWVGNQDDVNKIKIDFLQQPNRHFLNPYVKNIRKANPYVSEVNGVLKNKEMEKTLARSLKVQVASSQRIELSEHQ